MAPKSPSVQPTRQRNVFTEALFHVCLEDQNSIVLGDVGIDADDAVEDTVCEVDDP